MGLSLLHFPLGMVSYTFTANIHCHIHYEEVPVKLHPAILRTTSGLISSVVVLAMAQPAYAKDDREVVHSESEKVVVNSFDRCVRTKWSTPGDECSPPAPAPAPQ